MSKQEIRDEVISQIKEENKAVYSVDYVKQLEENDRIVRHWIKNNPKEAMGLIQFVDGYHARGK